MDASHSKTIENRATPFLLQLPVLDTNATLDEVSAVLRRGERGVCFLRYGDGEYMAMHHRELQHNALVRAVLRDKQWGHTPTEAHLDAVRDSIKHMLRHAQYLGIAVQWPMEQWRPRRDAHWALRRMIDPFFSRALASPERARDTLGRWFAHAPQVGIVNCRERVADTLRAAYPHKRIVFYRTPSEVKWRAQFPDDAGAPAPAQAHYPYHTERICAALRDVVQPGALWLLGAGVFKCFYARAIQERGGVAVDLGAVFDFWDGKVTRVKHAPQVGLALTADLLRAPPP